MCVQKFEQIGLSSLIIDLVSYIPFKYLIQSLLVKGERNPTMLQFRWKWAMTLQFLDYSYESGRQFVVGKSVSLMFCTCLGKSMPFKSIIRQEIITHFGCCI